MGRLLRVAPLAAGLTLACNSITGLSALEKVDSIAGDGGAGAAATQIVVGRKTSCALVADKSVWCWGANPGVAPGAVSTTPVHVTKLKNIDTLSIGLEHVCAVDASGTVSCWGRNDSGQLGDGTNAPSPEPKAVPSLPIIDTIIVGTAHSCAHTKPDSDPVQGYCWGQNDSGELGDGSPGSRSGPVKIVLPSGAKIFRLSPGAGFTAAIISTGGLLEAWCWGKNDKGQCGQDPNASPTVVKPTKVPGLPQLERVYAGTDHVCARTPGTKIPWCWGANDQGQLGRNSTSPFGLALAVLGGESVDTMHSGARHSCLTKSDSLEALCWGANDLGQLGGAPSAVQPLPSPAPYLDRVDGLSMRQAEHGCRIVKGIVSCFGSNDSGQLGNGKIEPFGGPVVVKLR
jgi:alpha-tubulin suppressor-like RCC1 family protein